MRFGELKSVAHNIADSLASGIGLLIGVYETDIWGEAAASEQGYIEVDFLKGYATGAVPSPSLADAIRQYSRALNGLCERHGFAVSEISELKARYGTDRVLGPHFRVTVESKSGRRSTDQYVGSPGKKWRPREPIQA